MEAAAHDLQSWPRASAVRQDASHQHNNGRETRDTRKSRRFLPRTRQTLDEMAAEKFTRIRALYDTIPFVGVLGATVSISMRVSGLVKSDIQLTDLTELGYPRSSIHLMPLLGAAFGLLTAFLIYGGFVNGAFFPDINSLEISDYCKLLLDVRFGFL
jgi:hypothetical protein